MEILGLLVTGIRASAFLYIVGPFVRERMTRPAEPAVKRRKLSPPGTSVPGFAKWNLEQDYEQRPRKRSEKKKAEKLPVKTAEGWEENARNVPEEIKKNDDDADSFLASDDGGAEENGTAVEGEEEVKAEPPKPRLPPKEEIRQAKEDLARVAGHVSENPEENIGQLGQLAQIGESENATVRKLALGAQLAVFKDIIPGYRIRPLSKDEMNGKLSKDVRKLRTFEQGLLGGYREYVRRLERLAGDADAGSVATACACALVTSMSHFNCRNELVALLVKKLSSRQLTPDGVKCLEALEQLFRDDDEGHASLEAVTQLTTMLKRRNFHVPDAVLNSFLHLRLLSEFARKASTTAIDRENDEDPRAAKKALAKKHREFRTKRERKVIKERKGVEKEMQEADAAVGHEARDRNQAETLKLVFVAYFRILKARIPHLMGAVLEGLAKYAHLINQDFFGDILEVLKDLITHAEASLDAADDEGEEDDNDDHDDEAHSRNARREILLAIITASALLHGQYDVAKSANTLHLDLDFFTSALDRLLLPLALDPHLEDPATTKSKTSLTPASADKKINFQTPTPLLLRALSAVLLPPPPTKPPPPTRLIAFTKKSLSLALHLPPKSCAALLALLTQVARKHSAILAPLWRSEGGEIGGMAIWEGDVLKSHFCESSRKGWAGVVGGFKLAEGSGR